MLINLQNRSNITTSITIIGCRPNSDQFFIKYLLVSFHNKLMCSTDQRNTICTIKLLNTRLPKNKASSLGETSQLSISSGSDHIKSHIAPAFGIYCFRYSDLISSMLGVSGDRPPCTHNILSSMSATRGRKSNISVKYFHTLSDPYFLKHSS